MCGALPRGTESLAGLDGGWHSLHAGRSPSPGGGGSKRDQHGYPPGQTIRNWKPKPTTENPDKRPRTGRRLMSPPLGGSSSEAGKCGRAAGRHPHGSPRARPRTGPDRWSNCMPEIETAKMPKNSNYAKINFLTQRFPKTALF